MTRRRLLITGGSALALACLLGILAVTLGGGTVPVFDQWWHDLIISARPELLIDFAQVMNRVGGGVIAGVIVPLLIGGALFAAGRRWAALYALLAFLVSAGLVQLLKTIFGRARPDDMLVASDYGSFPSGHTANAATIAVVLWLIFPRVWVAIAGLIWTVLMGFSRTVLAVHWITDTLGGALVGAAAAMLLAAIVPAWLARSRRATAAEALAAADTAVAVQAATVASASAETAVSRIRPYRPSDDDALLDVCVRTADSGGDATGLFTDDRLWGDIFAVPYAHRHPDLARVVEAADGRVIGYIVATDDTDAFEQWFRDEWWPTKTAQYPLSGEAEPTRQDRMIGYAAGRAPGAEQHAAEYPAHLHIDLLPETQGQGLGRRLIESLFTDLRARGVTGLHLGMNPSNGGPPRSTSDSAWNGCPRTPTPGCTGCDSTESTVCTRRPARNAGDRMKCRGEVGVLALRIV